MTNADIANASLTLPASKREKKDAAARLQREFYLAVLNKAEQIALQTAEQLDGLDEEIALLRTKLRTLAELKRPRAVHYQLMTRGMDTLAHLMSVRYRISKKSHQDLASSLAAVLQSARSELGLGEDDVA